MLGGRTVGHESKTDQTTAIQAVEGAVGFDAGGVEEMGVILAIYFEIKVGAQNIDATIPSNVRANLPAAFL